MPDRRIHRGPHPEDGKLFAPAAWPRLGAAVADYSWLLTRGYAEPSALKLMGNRFELNQRQRAAVARCACSDADLERRRAKEVPPPGVAGQPLWIDGFNLLTTIEVALGRGVVLSARDGCYRDIASVHGTYRKVEETRPSIKSCGQVIQSLRPSECVWYLDSPVGNSGRLKLLLLDVARERGWGWRVQVVPNPDVVLIAADAIVATADSAILDRCRRWVNLARQVVDATVPNARVIPMSKPT